MEQVIAAGVIDIIDVWSFAQQPASVCFDQVKVGPTGGIIFIDKSALEPVVNLTPATTSEGSQTCINTNGPGLVVLVQNAYQQAVQPAASASTTLIDCMVRFNYTVNCRQSPGGGILSVVPRNFNLTALERDSGWYKVDNLGQQCWVSGDLVTENGTCVSGGLAVASSGFATALNNCMVTTTHVVNFRESPGGTVITQLPHDITLTAFERANEWTRVDYYGSLGWISASYLTESATCN